MNIDAILRDTMHSYAEQAPPAAGLVDAAQARSRHHRRTRHATLAGVGAVAAAAIAAPVVLLATGTGGPGWTDPAGPPPVELAAADRHELPVFPFTPGWVPDRFTEAQLQWSSDVTIEVGGVEVTERLELVHRGSLFSPDGQDAAIESTLVTTVWPADPFADLTGSAQELDVTVQDRPGRLFADQWRTVVVWEHEPEQWLAVTVWGDLPDEDLLSYADQLTDGPFVMGPPFVLQLLPVGADLTYLDGHHMQFRFGDNGWLAVTRETYPLGVEGAPCAPAPLGGYGPSAVPSHAPTMMPSPALTVVPSADPTMMPSPAPTVWPDSTTLPTAATTQQPAPTEPTWQAVEIDGWETAAAAAHAESTALCLLPIASDPQHEVHLSGSLNLDDLTRVAEALRING